MHIDPINHSGYLPTSICTMCSSEVRFTPFGQEFEVLKRRRVVGGFRWADQCPKCLSCSRDRLIHAYFDTLLDAPIPYDTLHFAPEACLWTWLKTRLSGNYVVADVAPECYANFENMIGADLQSVPFVAETFDLVICSHVLEHVPDDRAALREIHRVLRPGGLAILMVPEATDENPTDEDVNASIADRCRRFGQDDHLRLYARDDFVAHLQDTPFDVTSVCADDIDADLAINARINPFEYLRVCRKAASTNLTGATP